MSHLVEEARKLGAVDWIPFCPVNHGVADAIWPRLDVVSSRTGRRGHQWVRNGQPYWCHHQVGEQVIQEETE